ncbi:hypothetical protein H8356DRAFT_1360602 [Neocallimastix lanati (nom. inval.)]|nr:hypothetical protein H8356DRAFT_1360602 [Neocallimastix sp. JGI-2020a]
MKATKVIKNVLIGMMINVNDSKPGIYIYDIMKNMEHTLIFERNNFQILFMIFIKMNIIGLYATNLTSKNIRFLFKENSYSRLEFELTI